jgi:hypothetical protein
MRAGPTMLPQAASLSFRSERTRGRMQNAHAMNATRASVTLLVVSCLSTGPLRAGTLELHGSLIGRGLEVRSQPAWLTAGFGRLTEGAASPDDWSLLGRGQAQLAVDWKPSEVLLVHAHALGRLEGDGDQGQHAGVPEAFVQYRPELSPVAALRIRAGTFFTPTSRENVDPLWSSPYTLTLSALNTWIAEEARLSGVDALLRLRSSGGSELQVAGVAFAAADTMGALLAWRGWSFGNRLSTIGESLPLPPLPSFSPGGGFERQRSGTRPIDELDGRVGWQARARWQRSGGGLVQAAYTDNAGDRELHRGQYSWRTRFGQAGLEMPLGRSAILVGEAAIGDSGMGALDVVHVDIRFATVYALASVGGSTARGSVRYDWFRNEDKDGTAEPNGESGHAWTVAAFFRPHPHVRVGIEYLDVRGHRPAAAYAGADPRAGARRFTGELRLTF